MTTGGDADRPVGAGLWQCFRQFASRIAVIEHGSTMPSVLNLDGNLDQLFVAGRVRSRTAASEHPS